MDDDYPIAHARFALWSAQKLGTASDIARATSLLNQLLAEDIRGAEVTE